MELPHSKKQRLLDNLLNASPANDDDGSELFDDKFFNVSFAEMSRVEYTDCYACSHITTSSLKDNKYHYQLMKLYTENSTSICKDAIFNLVKEYYDTQLFPKTNIVWSKEAIVEHFNTHTNFPTDEVLMQIAINESVRKYLMNNLIEQSHDGERHKFQMNNLKMLISINKELRILRNSKNELPNQVGYDSTLNY